MEAVSIGMSLVKNVKPNYLDCLSSQIKEYAQFVNTHTHIKNSKVKSQDNVKYTT